MFMCLMCWLRLGFSYLMYMDSLTLTWNLQVAESRILKQSCVLDVWQDSELSYVTDFGDCNYTNSLPYQGHFTTRYCRCHSYGPPSCPHSLQMTCSQDTMWTNRENSTGIQKFYSITAEWMKHFVFSTLSKMQPFCLITLTHNTPIYTLQWSGDRPCSTLLRCPNQQHWPTPHFDLCLPLFSWFAFQ